MMDTSGSSKAPEPEAEGGAASPPPSNTDAASSAELGVKDGAAGGRAGTPAVPSAAAGPDDDEDYPGELNDAAPAFHPASNFRPDRHRAGVHGAATRAAARPIPAPAHEPELARMVREEINEASARRARARSTGTVRVPLELRKFGVPDLGPGESIASLLAEQPHDLMVAINRKHPEIWRRVLLLARAAGQRPAQALYAALEAGLDQLEPKMEAKDAA